jgi:hypothetical protein
LDWLLGCIQQVSILDHDEMATMISTFMVIHDEKLKCSKCIKRLTQQVRDSRMGCSVAATADVFHYKRTYFWDRCPANMWNGAYQELISSYRHFERGLLPFPGGLMDQPAKLIECFDLIESLILEDKKNRQEQQMAQAKRGKRG